MLTITRSGIRFLLGPVLVDLGEGGGGGGGVAGVVSTPDKAPVPTSSTFEGLVVRTPSSIGVLASLRQTPKAGWSLEARFGDSTKTMA